MQRSWRCTLLTLCVLVITALPARAVVAQASDVLRGHVRAVDGSAIAGAIITVTARDKSSKSARSDNQGAYSISFPAGSGPYAIAATMVGYTPQTREVLAPQPGSAPPDVDFRLEAAVQRLATVTTSAQRQRPNRGDRDAAGPGEGGSAPVLSSSLSGDLTGDIAAAMATVPGLLITPDANGGLPTISAFGLAGDQNALTLNGMNFGAGSIPRDGLTVRVVQSTYDPGRGGFSGVQTSLRLPSGTNTVNQTLHVTAEDPHLQSASPPAAQLGTQYRRNIVSGSWSGPIVEDKAYYSSSFQFSRRTSDLASLGAINPASLRSLGISADSVARLVSMLGPLGIPEITPAVPSNRISTNASGLARFDWAPNAGSRTGNVNYLIVGGNWSDNAGTRSSPTALASHGGDTRSWAAQIQGNSSRFIGAILNESNASFVASSNRTAPYLTLPEARVLVTSAFPDGSAGSSTLRAGGNPNAESDSRSWSVQGRNETSWFTWSGRHNIKVTVDGRVDHNATMQSVNRYGTFSYNSLADFAGARAASFTRTLAPRETRGQQFLGALGVGDVYRPIPQLRIQYGVRVEGNAFAERPEYNPSIETLFGRSTRHVPTAITVAPMIGFTRQYSSAGGGSFAGGIREYVGSLPSQTVQGVVRQTGLPDAIQQIACVGSAVPVAAWTLYGRTPDATPSQCADGTAGSAFSQTTPPVTLFANDFAPSRRWGAALSWSGRIVSRWIGSVAGNYSLNIQRPASYDLNFNASARFSLPSEDGRPVFVAPASIVTTSGSMSSVDSRRFSQFAQVNELRSDLRSEARQLVIGLAPVATGKPAGLGVTTSYRAYYTLTLNRDQFRGFGGGSTNGDPREAAWGSAGLPQHSFQLFGSMQIPRWFNIDAFGRIASGRRFTPMVNGDINGDGLANDRAFIFSPGDPLVGQGMSALLASGPKAARECLTNQMGRIAARNSCSGPWTQSLNLAISPDPSRFGLGGRGSISLVVSNVLAAADELLHGSNRLHYWGTNATPDAMLLNVRGFDPVARRFKYDVNPSFGSTSASRATSRMPFVIALDVRLRLGPDRDGQALKTFLKPRPADGTKVLDERQIRERLDHDAQNNFEDIVKKKAALRLTQDQIVGLNTLAARFDGVRDSVYTSLARYLASLNGNYMNAQAKKRWHDSFVTIARLYVLSGPAVRSILTEEQFASLPISMTAYFDMDEAQFTRLMASADFGSLLELITGEGPN